MYIRAVTLSSKPTESPAHIVSTIMQYPRKVGGVEQPSFISKAMKHELAMEPRAKLKFEAAMKAQKT